MKTKCDCKQCQEQDCFVDSCKNRTFSYENYKKSEIYNHLKLGLVSNSGWDLVSVIRKDIVNKQISKEWNKINSKVAYEIEDISIQCTFSPWEIIDGGSGKNVRFLLPIQIGELKFMGKLHNLSKVKLVISCTLDFVRGVNGEDTLDFYFDHMVSEQGKQSGAVYPIEVIDSEGNLSVLQKQAVLQGICQYLIQHRKQISYIFAAIKNQQSTEVFRPYDYDYTYLDMAPGYLAILAVCSNREISGLKRNISLQIKDVNTLEVLSVSASYYMQQIMLPVLRELFLNSNLGSYQLINDTLVNTEKIRMNRMTRNGISYYPTITELKAEIIGDTLKVSYQGNCDLHAKINMKFEVITYIKPYLESGVIKYRLSEKTYFSGSYSVPWYLSMLFGIANIIAKFLSDSIVAGVVKIVEMSLRWMETQTIQWNDGTSNIVPSNVYFSKEFVMEMK